MKLQLRQIRHSQGANMEETRAHGRRTWIKLYPQQCINGSIRQLEPDERSVWYDLLAFSALCAEPGLISDNDKRPYPVKFIANRLNIDLSLLEKSLKDFQDEGRITVNESGIAIVNFKAYQSEYQRQKPYREAKKAAQSFLVCNLCHRQVHDVPGMSPPFLSLVASKCPYCKTKAKGTLDFPKSQEEAGNSSPL